MADGSLSSIVGLLNLPAKVVEGGKHLLTQLLGKPFEELGGLAQDSISFWRWKNRLQIAHKAEKIMEEEKISTKVLPPSFLLPLLERAGDVEDSDLQEMWARLIASAVADPHKCHPSFSQKLSELSRDEAIVLSLLASRAWLVRGQSSYVGRDFMALLRCPDEYRKVLNQSIDSDRLGFYVAHLLSLGLIEQREETETARIRQDITFGPHDDDREIEVYARPMFQRYTIQLSAYGRSLLSVCDPHQQVFKSLSQSE